MRLAWLPATSLAAASLFPALAGAQPVPVASAAPPCDGAYSASVASVAVRGGVHVASIVLTRIAAPAKKLKIAATPAPSPPCVVAGFPALAFASAPKDALVTGRLSLVSSATLEMGAPVSFVIEYDGGATRGSTAACALLVRAGDGKTAVALALPNCGKPSQLAVSSYTPGPRPELGLATPEPNRSPPASVPCRAADLVPRVAAAVTAAGQSIATIAFQNRGESACELRTNFHVAFLDATSREIQPLSKKPAFAGSGTRLAAGREASVRLEFTSRGDKAACATATSVALALGSGTFTPGAPATFAVCGPEAPTISNLRSGVPLAQ